MQLQRWKRAMICAVCIGTATSGAEGKARRVDFDGDGVADVAIGVFGERVGGAESAGGVAILYGKRNQGLDDAGDQFFTMDSPGINGEADEDKYFGTSLAAGDFDNDGYTDLAIGIPGETVSGFGNAGAVSVLYGSANGLTSSGDQRWHADSNGIGGEAESGAFFGTALAAGDFDGDGRDDLAIGAPHANSNVLDCGEVHVLFGTSQGLKSSGDLLYTQDTGGMSDSEEQTDEFGAALAAGDFDKNGKDDLAIGVPGEDGEEGGVHVLYSTAEGPNSLGSDFFEQGSGGLPSGAGEDERVGAALTTGDFDDNGKDDLVIGAHKDTVGAVIGAGSVTVMYGTTAGLTVGNSEIWTQNSDGIRDTAETDDQFGAAIAAGDFDGDGRDDLAIGVWLESLGGEQFAGSVHVIYGGPNGLRATGDDFFTQNTTGIADSTEANDVFGCAVAAGDYDDDGRDDLVIGARGERVNGQTAAGVVHELFGTSGGPTGTGSHIWHQDRSGISDSAENGDVFGATLR